MERHPVRQRNSFADDSPRYRTGEDLIAHDARIAGDKGAGLSFELPDR